jgi:hypothetical protein
MQFQLSPAVSREDDPNHSEVAPMLRRFTVPELLDLADRMIATGTSDVALKGARNSSRTACPARL